MGKMCNLTMLDNRGLKIQCLFPMVGHLISETTSLKNPENIDAFLCYFSVIFNFKNMPYLSIVFITYSNNHLQCGNISTCTDTY